jgi:Flp pilus assembly protein TadD
LAEDRKGWREALTWYEKVTGGEAYITALSRRASVLQKMGDVSAARQLLQTAQVPSDKEKARLVLAEAAVLRDAKQEGVAQQVLEKSLARFPSDPDILYEYALGLEKQNKLELMESTLRQVMTLRPQDAQAYNALGYSLADRNVRLPEALALIERALSLQPDDAMIIDSLGWVQYRLGNLEKAIEHLRRAYTARPDAEIGAHLGEALWQAGQRDAARQIWREAEQREPDNQVLRETQRRLQATQ